MKPRHAATLAATFLALLSACPRASAQNASTDPTLAASTKDQGIVNEPNGAAPRTRERGNLFLGVGMVSPLKLDVREAGRSYAMRADSNMAFTLSACVRLGASCLGYGGSYAMDQRITSIDGLPLNQTAKIGSFEQVLFWRAELGQRIRIRPLFGLVLGKDKLTLPTVEFEGTHIDARFAFDLALPLGRHALAVQGGLNIALDRASMSPKNTGGRPVADVELQRQPAAYITIGPEFRL